MPLHYTWLPAASPEVNNPLHIIKTDGSHLITKSGAEIYDAISSWWCKPLGYRHPLIIESITAQLQEFDHHMAANIYNDVIEELSYTLASLTPGMNKVMYASDGSSAIEIAMKLSYEARIINGEYKRNKYVALTNAYHGETIFALSTCGINIYRNRYADLLQQNYFITNIPYVNSRHDPLWNDCNFAYLHYEQFFANIASSTTALIIEPIVQGAAGIKIISRNFLINLITIAKKYAIHIICDEIMVGLGRLGCHSVTHDILQENVDFICFAKNLTAGTIPMSAVVINRSITELFVNQQKTFLHSHTHSCNVLGAKVALSYLQFLNNSNLLSTVNECEPMLLQLMNTVASEFDFVINPRAIGAIAACDLMLSDTVIQAIFNIAIQQKIYLRPIGKTLYLMPPLYNLKQDLDEIGDKFYNTFIAIKNLVCN